VSKAFGKFSSLFLTYVHIINGVLASIVGKCLVLKKEKKTMKINVNTEFLSVRTDGQQLEKIDLRQFLSNFFGR
jgi:hypothetical protein